MTSKELLIIFITASVRKTLTQAGIGVPIRWLQGGEDGEPKVEDEVQILISFDFKDRANEDYVIVNVQALVKTKVVPTDVYYHTRVKARVAGILEKVIPVLKIGGTDTRIYDKTQIGILRRLPSDTIRITPTSIDVPDASVVETFLEYQSC